MGPNFTLNGDRKSWTRNRLATVVSVVLSFFTVYLNAATPPDFKTIEPVALSCVFASSDPAGNLLLAGEFEPNSLVRNVTLTNEAGIFLIQFDRESNVVWKVEIHGNTPLLWRIDSDPAGNLFVLSEHSSSTATVQNQQVVGTNASSPMLLLTKLTKDGAVSWTHFLDDSFNVYGKKGMTVDHEGNCLVFTSKTGLTLGKVSPTGSLLWSKQDGNASLFPRGISCDGFGSIFISAAVNGAVTVAGTSFDTGSNSQDALLLKYDAAGNAVWARQAGGAGWDSGWGVHPDDDGNTYFSGYFSPPNAQFGATIVSPVNTNSETAFVAKYDSTGNVLWVTAFAGVTNPTPERITLDAETNVYVAGASATVSSLGFIAKLDAKGELLWFKRTEIPAGYETHDISVLDMATDYLGNLHVTGRLYGSMQFDSVILGTTNNFSPGTGFYVTIPAAPPLLYAAASAGELVLSWVTNQPNYTLEWTSNLGSTNAWTSLPTVASGKYNVSTNTISTQTQFFRLRKE